MNLDSKVKILTADFVLPISSAPLQKGAIAVNADKIAAVGARQDILSLFPDAVIEEFGEAAILPGLVNAHTHLELTAMRGFLDDVEHDFYSWLRKLTIARAEKMKADDLLASAMGGAIEAARAGITCLADICTQASESITALKNVGLRGIIYQEITGPDQKSAEQKFEQLRDQVAACREIETRKVKIGVTPHAPYSVSPKLFQLATDFALSENLPVTIHVAESADEDEFLRHGSGLFSGFYDSQGIEWNAPGISPIEYLHSIGALRTAPLLAHCVRVSEGDLEIVSETRSRIAHCPKSNAKFAHGIAPLKNFLEKNIKTGLGSDSVASNNVADILEEARFAALLSRAKGNFISAETVLHLATLGGAKALGLENEIGSLEAGKQADLIVVKLDRIPPEPIHSSIAALVFASSSRDVVLTMVCGIPVSVGGKIIQTDEAHWRKRLKETAHKLSV
ncbi:MAG: amidohydrolase family protein [Acidobacteriota bacterium]|nr:amidohydrolase family protein [Acidobacteriota bacterium]